MCCFSKPVESVANTRIFARLTKKDSQYLVYQMKYVSEEFNAMILPLPIALPSREDSVRFIPLDKYPKFFSDLDRGFPALPPRFLKKGGMGGGAFEPPPNNLVVHEVGDFVASFVPTMDDFHRLDPQFVISRESWSQIPAYKDYGFAVFQLKELAAEPHPMAFEFETRTPEILFFPTVHIHDGEVHEQEKFDHMLYLQHSAFDKASRAYLGPHESQKLTGFVRSNLNAEMFCNVVEAKGILDAKWLVHRVKKKGMLNNVDFVKDVSSKATRKWRSTSRASWPSYLGFCGVSSVASVAWIIRRRMELAEKNQEET
jgi:hypothetical protein